MNSDSTTDPENSDESADAASTEARRATRRRVLKAGRIAVKENFSTFDILIRDMSDTGVKLKLSQPFIVPEVFDLIILNTNTGISEKKTCVRRWQNGVLVGAQFADGVQNKAQTAPDD